MMIIVTKICFLSYCFWDSKFDNYELIFHVRFAQFVHLKFSLELKVDSL